MNKDYFDRVTLGTASLGGAWRPIDEKESIRAILYALESGLSHIDMAPAYMNAEEIVGKALKSWTGTNLFLSTKIGKRKGGATQTGLIDYSIPYLEESLTNSLRLINKDQIDLLFLHEPDQIPIGQLDEVMEKVFDFKQRGLINQIGLGGTPSSHLKNFIEQGHFDVIMDFNGFNLVENKALNHDFPYYKSNNLQIYEGSPLMMGLLGRRLDSYAQSPPSWLSKENLERALKIRTLAIKNDLDLSGMAHRFLLFQDKIDRMVIGPGNYKQLQVTLNDLQMGPLPSEILNQINNL